MREEWTNFAGGKWESDIDVRDFIQRNYTPYDGDQSFLEGPTEATDKLWGELKELQKEERAKGGVLDMETEVVSGITAYGAAYLDKDLEKVVGLQTDKPLKRAFMPYGGIKMAEQSCQMYGYTPSPKLHEIFTKYHKTHNQGVFDIYTPEMKLARHNKILTGLPDTYGRGRIVGDYRRVALYGIDRLIEGKKEDFAETNRQGMRRGDFQLREEIADQIRALNDMKEMALSYGFDISQPAKNAAEAVQWLYFGYLAAIKTQNGAAMSVGRVSTFLDIYIERDLENGTLTESQAQELVDHFVMKCRMVKFARIESYNQLFSGDPVWATLEVAGLGIDGRSMVTKNDYRFLHTLENMGPSPEPNLTVLYSSRLPENFKKYAAHISVTTSSIQYENDDVMRPVWGDDYSICCCVSATQTGKEIQFFGARANLAKCLLYAINGGIDEKTKMQVGPEYTPITSEYLDYDEVIKKYDTMMDWLAHLYVGTLNMIHYMHDKYYYEAAEMALIDTDVRRTFATGIAASHMLLTHSALLSTLRLRLSVTRTALLLTLKQRATSQDTVTMTREQIRLPLTFSRHLWLSSSIATHTEIQSLQLLSLQSHQMLFTVRLQVHFLTAEKQASRFHRVLTQATVQSRTVFLLHLTLLLSFLTSTLLTVFQILRQSTRVLSDTTMTSVLTTS